MKTVRDFEKCARFNEKAGTTQRAAPTREFLAQEMESAEI
jgi:hypothetical protein